MKRIFFTLLAVVSTLTGVAAAQQDVGDFPEVIRTLPDSIRDDYRPESAHVIKPVFGLGYLPLRRVPSCTLSAEGGVLYYRDTGSRDLRGRGSAFLFPPSATDPGVILGRIGLSRFGLDRICYGVTLGWKFGYWGPNVSTNFDFGHSPGKVDGKTYNRMDFEARVEQPMVQRETFYASAAIGYELFRESEKSDDEDRLDGEHMLEFLGRMVWRPYPLQRYGLGVGYRIGMGGVGGSSIRPGSSRYAGSVVTYFDTQSPLGPAGSLGSRFGIVVEGVGRFGIKRQHGIDTCSRDITSILRGYPAHYRDGDSCIGANIQLRFAADRREIEYDYFFIEYANILGFDYEANKYPESKKIWYLGSVTAGLSKDFGDIPLTVSLGIGWPLFDLPKKSSFLDSMTGFFELTYRH